jgi:hypothetical protein
MKIVRYALIGFWVASCGSGSTSESGSRLALQLSSSESRGGASATSVELRAGETERVVLVAIGADQPVTFAGRDLPAFAKLEGALLTLAPQRNDAGDYALTLTANAGRESASGDLRVHVLRFNTAPTWSPSTLLRVGSLSQSFGDSVSGLGARYPCPDPTFCTAASDPYVALRACDAEGDGIVVELEVVPRGRPFENKPTFSASAPPVYPPPASGNCPAVLVHMPGLIPGGAPSGR